MRPLQQWSRQSRQNLAAVRRLRLARPAVLVPSALLLLWMFWRPCSAAQRGRHPSTPDSRRSLSENRN